MARKKLSAILATLLILSTLSGCKETPSYELKEKEETLPVTTTDTDAGIKITDELGEQKNYRLEDENHINALKETSTYMNKLSAEMLKLNDNQTDNIMISGFSAYTAISAIAKYAENDTTDQLKTALGEIKYDSLDYFKTHMPIESSTMFIIDDQLKLNTPDVSTFLFHDLQHENIVDTVNNLSNELSHGMIPSMISAPFKDDIGAVILDGLYFKGGWVHKFDEALNYEDTFYGSSKETKTTFMENTENYDINTEDKIISLRYQDSDLTMDICYDLNGKSASEMFEYYTQNLESISNKTERKKVDLKLPKFTVDSNLNITDAYKALGITHLFDENYSKDLSSLADNIFVSDAMQKTKIIVDEKGTEASAITLIVMGVTSAYTEPEEIIDVTVNKPFLYVIRDSSTDIILFAGYIYNF